MLKGAAAAAAPLVVGITGSIGAGKSAVAAQFAALGFAVHDADAAVHSRYEPAGAASPAVLALGLELGADVATAAGGVDRAKLSALLKVDTEERLAALDAIVHPLVSQARAAFVEEHRSDFLCVLDIPLLFESAGERHCDAVVVASTMGDTALRQERVLARGWYVVVAPPQTWAAAALRAPLHCVCGWVGRCVHGELPPRCPPRRWSDRGLAGSR